MRFKNLDSSSLVTKALIQMKTTLNQKEKLDLIESREESFWRDKARELFIKQGDKNTKYFQAKAKDRYKQNKNMCL